MKKSLYFILIVGALILVFFLYPKNKSLINTDTDSDNTSYVSEENIDPHVAKPDIKEVSSELNSFYHKVYQFSFDYPKTFLVSNFLEGDGEQIIFNNKNKDWFQVYITPWDDGEALTVQKIKKDIPGIKIIDPKEVVLGPDQKNGIGEHALIFFSEDGGVGDTREVWFVHGSSLYQISTHKSFDLEIGKILSTLVFKY